MTQTKAPTMSAARLRELLAVRYAMPEWHLEEEVTFLGRRLDAVAFGLWKGGGRAYRTIGFELKVSRADWLRELSQLEKAAGWMAAVDQFVIVAPKEMIPPSELPVGWGLLECTERQLRVKVHPAKATPGETLPREVVARVLARQVERSNAATAQARTALRHEIADELRPQIEARVSREAGGHAEKAAAYDALMAEAGLSQFDNPVRILRVTRALQKSLRQLPDHWAYSRATADVTVFAERVKNAVAELATATEPFRALAEIEREVPA
ncbi:MAG: hypothetical protein ACYC0B_01985 [Gemmatimonadaceae bacterium]